jgi:acetate kinase
MRTLLEKADKDSSNAIEYYVYHAAREIGSLTATLGGLDALIFTGGIGEHSAVIRKLICERERWLGIEIDDAANQNNEIKIHSAQSKISVLTIPTNEESIIAKHTISNLTC